MDNFRTVLSLTPSSIRLGLGDTFFTTGSCFADNLGRKLQDYKFQGLINPFGTSYNPLSIHKALHYALQNSSPAEDTYGELNQTFFNYDFHGSFSTLSKRTLEANLISAIKQSHEALSRTKILLITYGTAWVYERIDNREVVANCHKVPGKHFEKKLLTQKKVLESFETLYGDLKRFNPHIKIILTVSPVRHLRDTLELNAVSKSILRIACHTLTEIHNDVEYFPAYEIVLDDLRDYRFYNQDLLHPSEEAIDYIWKLFCQRYFSEETQSFIKQWSDIRNALQHKPFLSASATHQAFLKGLVEKLKNLKPAVNVDKEISQVEKQLLK